MTTIFGICQSDIVVRTAIMQGLQDLRDNPDLLNYCFAWLPKDDLTAKQYGTRTVEEAKRWFLNTEINVSLDVRLDQAKTPIITITLAEGAEDSATLGDVNYDPAEEGPSVDEATNLESVRHRETYTLGLYVSGEPLFLLFLNSIVLFLLYRYKKAYFEGRGFEGMTLQLGRMSSVESIESQPTFTRPINITGFVRHFWPAAQSKKLNEVKFTGTDGGIRILNEKNKTSPPSTDLNDPMWSMEDDVIGAQPNPLPAVVIKPPPN